MLPASAAGAAPDAVRDGSQSPAAYRLARAGRGCAASFGRQRLVETGGVAWFTASGWCKPGAASRLGQRRWAPGYRPGPGGRDDDIRR